VASAAAPLSAITELSDRIIRLEAMLAGQTQPESSQPVSSAAETTPSAISASPPHSSKICTPSPQVSQTMHADIPEEVRVAATTLAQSAIAHEGEYLGTGSLVSSIHKVSINHLGKILSLNWCSLEARIMFGSNTRGQPLLHPRVRQLIH
jgi:hypothetical protein